MKNVIIFDFDKTLTNRDTLSGFYALISKEKSFRPFRHVLYFITEVGYFLKIFGNDTLKKVGVRLFLKGISFECYQDYCQIYAARIQMNTNVINLLKNRQKQGYEVWILSASFEDYIKCTLNVNVEASKLRVKSGKIVGLDINNYGRRKKSFLLSHFKNRAIKEFYTDHISDFAAASLSESVFMVSGNIIEEINLGET